MREVKTYISGAIGSKLVHELVAGWRQPRCQTNTVVQHELVDFSHTAISFSRIQAKLSVRQVEGGLLIDLGLHILDVDAIVVDQEGR